MAMKRNKDTDNSRNSYSEKTLKTSLGNLELAVPRDRKREFEPQLVKKNQTTLKRRYRGKDFVHVRQGHGHQRHRSPYPGDIRKRQIRERLFKHKAPLYN
jgi:hypothetical protein